MKIKYLIISAILLMVFFGFCGTANALTAQDLQAQIQALMQQIASLQVQLSQMQGGSTVWCHTFTTSLRVGDDNQDVSDLRTALYRDGEQLPIAGAVNDTSFDDQVASAVVAFQEKYASEILTPNGLKHGTGFVGVSTKAKLNALYGCNQTACPTLIGYVCGKDGKTYDNDCFMKNAGVGLDYMGMCKTSDTGCKYLYWFDNTNGNQCQAQKQFCGTYMYYGLKTFDNQKDCLSAFYLARGNCTPSWKCDWGSCVNGYQSQVAVDTNYCALPASGASIACPALARQCEKTQCNVDSDCPQMMRACYINSDGSANCPPIIKCIGGKCVSDNSTNKSPVISGVSGPTTLNVNQAGTWTINASDPENGTLSYSVIWGDNNQVNPSAAASNPLMNYAQTTTFTHSYALSGIYTISFMVRDNVGNQAQSSISVNVGGIANVNCGKLIYFSADTCPYCKITNPVVDEYAKNTGCVQLVRHALPTVSDLSNDAMVKQYGVQGTPSFIFVDKSGCFASISDKGGATKLEDIINGIANFKCPKPSITILWPNGGETFEKNKSIPVKWQFSNLSSTQTIDIVRLRAYPNGQEYNLNATNFLASNGSVNVELPSTLPVGAYTLELKGYAGNTLLFDSSDSYFKIVDNAVQCTTDSDCTQIACFAAPCPVTKCISGKCVLTSINPSITVTSPNGGENWQTGTTHDITWTSSGIGNSVYISWHGFNSDGKETGSYVVVNAANASTGKFTWTIPSDVIFSDKERSKILITSVPTLTIPTAIAQGANDMSDNYFSITASGVSACTDLDGGQNVYVASSSQAGNSGMMDGCDFSLNSNGVLKEAICKDGQATNITLNCPSDAPYCRYGKCVSTNTPVCTDSDGGESIYTQGTAKQARIPEGPDYTDYCENLSTFQPFSFDPLQNSCTGGANCGLREYYCISANQDATFKDIACPNGCGNGACKQASIQPSITVTSPNGGETWKAGETHNITWNLSNIPASYVFNIILEDYLSSTTNSSFIATVPASQNTYSWTLPANIIGNKFKIDIGFNDGPGPGGRFVGNDISDNYFSIVPASATACTDSDGGRNYYTQGGISGLCYDCTPNVVFGGNTDLCMDASTLREFYCTDAFGWIREDYKCPNGCENGACKKSSVAPIQGQCPAGSVQVGQTNSIPPNPICIPAY